MLFYILFNNTVPSKSKAAVHNNTNIIDIDNISNKLNNNKRQAQDNNNN